MIKRENLRIRDPFILTDRENACYYMYGTTCLSDNSIRAGGSFMCYKTRDLENFEEPVTVVDGAALKLPYDRDFRAAEVHRYNGKYYLFGSVKADNLHRATLIFVCDRPDGSFTLLSERARTPLDNECLDGTLYVENNIPYLVYSHEWVQIKNGRLCAVQMSEDLRETVGEPFVLFSASENPYVEEINGAGSGLYVTDGPFLYNENGKLRLIWSSFAGGGYRILIAESRGGIRDGWKHLPPVYNFDGGHAMLFKRLDGEVCLSFHTPNTPPGSERAAFLAFDNRLLITDSIDFDN